MKSSRGTRRQFTAGTLGAAAAALIPVMAWAPALWAGELAENASSPETPTGPPTVKILETREGVKFGVWGPAVELPAPTLFVFAGSMQLALGDPYYRQSGTALAEEGFLCVSVDLPCHGFDTRRQEPEGLSGWRQRLERGEPLIADLNQRLAGVLDDLIARGYTDATKVAACGVSRGGFVALHFAARDPRVRCVAAFSPVTDLAVLSEFDGASQLPAVRALALISWSEKLAGRPLWIVIGDRDQRVGTDAAIALARQVTRASQEAQAPPQVELHVIPEPRGHAVPDGAFGQAAAWITGHLGHGRRGATDARKPEADEW